MAAQPISNRYDFSLFYEVENGNPNGDPDAGNMPRMDIETGNGLVTDVCIKRKIRNYVQMKDSDQSPNRIYIQDREPLNRFDLEAMQANNIDTSLPDKQMAEQVKKMKKTDPQLDVLVRDYMCSNFFDIRTFGAVMTTFVKNNLSCGQVRGPVQLGFSRSLDPILPQEVTITRVAITTEERAEDHQTEMGNKFIVPYAVYRLDGYVSANLAQHVTGFSEDDVQLLWEAMMNMFEFDRSAARGNMETRKLYVFKHGSVLGDAPSYKLFDAIDVRKRDGITVPRHFNDYEFAFNCEDIPDSVEVSEMVEGLKL